MTRNTLFTVNGHTATLPDNGEVDRKLKSTQQFLADVEDQLRFMMGLMTTDADLSSGPACHVYHRLWAAHDALRLAKDAIQNAREHTTTQQAPRLVVPENFNK